MKKFIIISLIIFSVIISGFLAFDSSNKPSNNNEGLKKSEVVANDSPGFKVFSN